MTEESRPNAPQGETPSGDAVPRPVGGEPATGGPPPRLAPVAAGERYGAVDVLRGFAVLGILVMNIYAFAMPFAAYNNPTLWGGEGIHFGIWYFTHFFFEQKFVTIFSMLFGAGLILMSERAEARGVRFGWIYYRRMFWMLVIGAAHGYLVWFGDILFNYAATGLLLYPLRRLRPRTLIAISLVLLAIPLAVSRGMGENFKRLKATAETVEARLAAGEEPSAEEQESYDEWRQMKPLLFPDEREVRRQLEIHRDGYVGIFKERIPVVFALQGFLWLTFALWRYAGMMLLGMALMKLGVLRAARSERFYRVLLAAGYVSGLPLAAYSGYALASHHFDPFYLWDVGIVYNYVGSLLMALGHVALVMLAVQSGLLAGLRRRLAAVGRMALTNYLMHSLVMTTIFYGYGLGLHGYVDRFYQMGFVLAMWVVQLYVSPLWLRHYRFGPAEWLWRSLAYWRRQPMRVVAPSAAVSSPR